MSFRFKIKRNQVLFGLLAYFAHISTNQAALTDLADSPVTTLTTVTVLPNLMFVLDDSGSMKQDYTPDYVNDSLCYDARDFHSTLGNTLAPCFPGDPPFMSPDVNSQYYNPEIYYEPPVNAAGTAFDSSFDANGNQNPAAAKTDPFGVQQLDMLQKNVSSVNLTTASWPDRQWCKTTGGGAQCTTNTSDYTYPNATYGYGQNGPGAYSYNTFYGSNSGPFNINFTSVYPYYWRLEKNASATPYNEYCTDEELGTCATTASPTYSVGAKLRWCTSSSLTNCQARYLKNSSYTYPRYVGNVVSGVRQSNKYTWRRVNIMPSAPIGTFPKYPARIDCVANAAGCIYAEEIQNFANWFSYYRTRMQAMKSATSLAFKMIDDKFKVGYSTINYTGVSASNPDFLPVAKFDSSQKGTWYSRLQGANFTTSTGNVGTPLQKALDKIGKYYRGDFSPSLVADPIEYYCQRNFTVLTTDGYWNQSFSFGNYDNDPSDGISTRGTGRFDGGSATNASSTLADVAMYYYKTDLRTGASDPKAVNNLPATTDDPANWQHMVTHTLGLGVSGEVRYKKDYDSSPTGDFRKIIDGAGGCSWRADCNWPVPVANAQSAVDDLWHAAVNGHGKYFSAKDPADLVQGLREALGAIKDKVGSGAAGATSTPFITATNNSFFITKFSPDSANNDWSGNIIARHINPATGQVLTSAVGDWDSEPLLDARVSPTSNSRVIYTFNSAGSRKNFDAASLSATELAYFANKGSLLGQYPALATTDQAILNSSSAMVGFLRGDTANLGTVFRDRQHVLGDTVHSKPIFVEAPTADYTDAGYAAFKAAQASRIGTLYVGANDGMIHAFDETTGAERWAYVPKLLMPNMYLLAEKFYLSGHHFFVDGEQVIGDVKFSNGNWKTILVSGMGKGARGFVALDVTDPNNPLPLWEICHDSTLCGVSNVNLGYSFGNPVITKRPSDGKWVVIVTSGHNNVSPGDGKGRLYVLDAETGAILNGSGSGTSNSSGSTSAPSGLSRLNVWVDDPQYDNTGKYAYAGDLNGDMWRFDLTGSSVSVMKMGTFRNASGQTQPVTVKPELMKCDSLPMVVLGTGKLLGQSDLTTTQIQSLYGIVDKGVPYPNASLASGSFRVDNLVQQTSTTSGSNITMSNNAVNLTGGANGWFYDLPAGERVNIDPAVALGTLTIVGNTPTSSNACENQGISTFYTVAGCTGGPVLSTSTTDPQGRKNPSAMTAGCSIYQLADGTLGSVCVTTAGDPINYSIPVSSSAAGLRRVSWRELVQ